MLGIILCGGQSLRMGTDKGLLSHRDKLWAQLAYDKLSLLDLPVKFSVNPSQEETYANYFGKEKLIVDNLSFDIRGPLLGVLSAHLLNSAEDLFLLACDMLLMETKLLQQVLNSFETDNAFDAYLFTKGNQLEPLCGIYKVEGLKKILNMLQNNTLLKHSMKYTLGNLKVCEIMIDDQDYHYFSNFNSQGEINNITSL